MSRRLDAVVIPGEAASPHLPFHLIGGDAPLTGQQADEEPASHRSPGEPRVTMKHVVVVTQDPACYAKRPCEPPPKLQLAGQNVEPRHARIDHERPGQDAHRHPGPRGHGVRDPPAASSAGRPGGGVRARAQTILEVPLAQCLKQLRPRQRSPLAPSLDGGVG